MFVSPAVRGVGTAPAHASDTATAVFASAPTAEVDTLPRPVGAPPSSAPSPPAVGSAGSAAAAAGSGTELTPASSTGSPAAARAPAKVMSAGVSAGPTALRSPVSPAGSSAVSTARQFPAGSTNCTGTPESSVVQVPSGFANEELLCVRAATFSTREPCARAETIASAADPGITTGCAGPASAGTAATAAAGGWPMPASSMAADTTPTTGTIRRLNGDIRRDNGDTGPRTERDKTEVRSSGHHTRRDPTNPGPSASPQRPRVTRCGQSKVDRPDLREVTMTVIFTTRGLTARPGDTPVPVRAKSAPLPPPTSVSSPLQPTLTVLRRRSTREEQDAADG